MSRFRFRLASVLKLREATRDERRAKLAEAYSAEEKLRGRRRQVEADLTNLNQLRHERAAARTVDVELFVNVSRYEATLRHELGAIAGHEAQLAVEIERRRQALVAADHEVRMLEKLRERKQQLHQQAEALAEGKQLDEIAARQSWQIAHEQDTSKRLEEIHE